MPAAVQTEDFLGAHAIIRSEPMLRLLELLRKIARSDAAVLITGESGTGKELIARGVHHYSFRCDRPWIDINCASIPEHLLESELFGYEKGAFSGADTHKQGLFEMAHTGALFLDEIGELESRIQVKLLRVLDGASYYRLGGVRKVSVDVRIVAATNQDLERQIQAGRFRSDLYHRLSAVHIHVPPLRERPEDIVPLAEFFLGQHGGKAALAPDAIAFLHEHTWPGTVRELRNAVTSAMLVAGGGEIRAEHLRPVALNTTRREWNLDSMERRMILQALAATGGRQQRAADLLGISQRTLSRKLKRFQTRQAGPSYGFSLAEAG